MAYQKWNDRRVKTSFLLRAFVALLSLLPFSEDTKEKRGPQIVPHGEDEVINHE